MSKKQSWWNWETSIATVSIVGVFILVGYLGFMSSREIIVVDKPQENWEVVDERTQFYLNDYYNYTLVVCSTELIEEGGNFVENTFCDDSFRTTEYSVDPRTDLVYRDGHVKDVVRYFKNESYKIQTIEGKDCLDIMVPAKSCGGGSGTRETSSWNVCNDNEFEVNKTVCSKCRDVQTKEAVSCPN